MNSVVSNLNKEKRSEYPGAAPKRPQIQWDKTSIEDAFGVQVVE